MSNRNLYIGIGIVVVLIVLWYFCWYRKQNTSQDSSKPVQENYVAAGGLDHVGSFDNYELIQAPDMNVPATHFADLVDEGCDQGKEYGLQQPENLEENIRPMERLHRVCGESLMPRTSLSVTPYNVDVAQPVTSSYMVNSPRVFLKSANCSTDYGLTTAIRGDIPITIHPNIPLISNTRYGRDDLRLDGLFSDQFRSLYNKYTGKAYKNMPLMVAGAGASTCGSGGAQGSTIMDSY